ncbi:MAG: DUF1705 domain-containing protein, partial [Betaproteobacteria bacterium]
MLLASLFFALSANGPFWRGVLDGRVLADASTWRFAAGVAVMLLAVHVLIVAPFAHRWVVKPLLALLLLVTAFASFFMQRYAVFLDPTMLRNVLRTDVKEARELLGPALALHVLAFGVLPAALLWRVR